MMSLEVLNTIGSVGTFLVIAATAIAAIVQLRHLRAANQLDAVLSLERDFRGHELQEAFRYVQRELPFKLRDQEYRAELEAVGFIDERTHLEVKACNWFNEMGTLVKNQLVTEDAFMDLFSRLVINYWERLEPAVAVMRRRRGDVMYHDFEYLAIRARTWLQLHPHGTFPIGMRREALRDPWAAEDTRKPEDARKPENAQRPGSVTHG
jgi:hypothetical protein